jgi:hypothetical protein
MARISAFDILNRSAGQARIDICGGMRGHVWLAGFGRDRADLRGSI